ncbi:hypothetical protein FRB91_007479 [Serendipita sp. 411]|nr:hypothetical protein FRC19_008898 [Serendipita sp. 401]KAG8859593.1 hypothetical protein FRB91_007479 [Serendipita sp. 411]KAG9056664.1 hypothetical protein FS842_009966 [Serendipita sp. 407]
MPPRVKSVASAVSAVGKAPKSSSTPRKAPKRKAKQSSDESGSDYEVATPSKRPKSSRMSPKKAVGNSVDKVETTVESQLTPAPPKVDWSVERPAFLPASLSFSYDGAQAHLINADPRFSGIFERLKCRPFVQLERVEPFRTLTTSIISQQISWKAARSVNWKFMRLYDDSLPENIPPPDEYVPPERFPPPHIVAETDLATLRSAGLSARKAEYIQDLAKHFADGRLSAEKIWNASDEELRDSLISVRGVGPWTIDMFAIFSLRRPNILPVGDLGVQRGILRWVLAQHNNPGSPIKLNQDSIPEDDDSTPVEEEPPKVSDATREPAATGANMAPPQTPVKKGKKRGEEGGSQGLIPEPFTPSINRVLTQPIMAQPFPPGLTVATLKSRLNGKNKVKGALLTPEEMEWFTESWKPYRSIGVWYMWSLADQDSDES